MHVKNTAPGVPHDVVIPELGRQTRSQVLGPGQSETYTFKATQAGTFDMICDIPGHAQAGMVGWFVVEK